MFRTVVRNTPRALRQPTVASVTGRRFASTAPADKKRYTWKGTATRWGLALGALYWYNTSPLFADEAPPRLSTEPPHFSESDLATVDAIVEEKRQTLDARLKAKEEQAARDRAAQPPPPPPPQKDGAVATAEDAANSPGEVEEEAGQQGAFNPETGEINWDCPCLGGMAHGPCGEEFKSAFSCFVYSTEEPKGMDCVDKFQLMQDCFRKYPEVYGEEIADEEAAEREAEAVAAGSPAAGGDGQNAQTRETDSAAAASTPSKKSEAPVKPEVQGSSANPEVEKKAHDATAENTKATATDAPKPAAPLSSAASPKDGDSQDSPAGLADGQAGIPKKSYDATSANAKVSK